MELPIGIAEAGGSRVIAMEMFDGVTQPPRPRHLPLGIESLYGTRSACFAPKS